MYTSTIRKRMAAANNLVLDCPHIVLQQLPDNTEAKLFFSRGTVDAKHFLKIFFHLGLDVSKPVFGVSDKARLKPACSATETT